jgi:hypothetical protein
MSSNPTGSQIATDQTPKKPGKVWGRPFAKGVSGNPGGRKKVPENVGDIAREATPDAIRTLIKIMKSEKASFAVRAYAAEKILDRAYGKPAQTNTLVVGQIRRKASDLSDDELLAIIDRGKQAKLIEAQTVEVEPSVEPQPVAEDVGEIGGTISETPE